MMVNVNTTGDNTWSSGWRLEITSIIERITGSHFLGGLMSFENLTHTPKSTRRVALLLFSCKVFPYVWRNTLKKKKELEEVK